MSLISSISRKRPHIYSYYSHHLIPHHFSLDQLHRRIPLAKLLLLRRIPRQPRLIIIRRHALDQRRRIDLPHDPLVRLARPTHPIRNISLGILDPHGRPIAILEIDNRHHGDASVARAPEVRAPRLGLALRTLGPFTGPAEADPGVEEGFRGEGRGAVPAGEDLEGFPGPEALERGGVVPEDVPGGVPAAVGGDLEEGVAVHAAGDPDVVEGRVRADGRPVHAADHVGFLVPALVDQFEDVLGADGHVV